MLIAEIGNNHFGSMRLAKKMIVMASALGATAVKLQAIEPGFVKGSMPPEFYQTCAFTEDQYIELMDYAMHEYSIPCFYSIFSSPDKFTNLKARQPFFKVSGGQTRILLKSEGHPTAIMQVLDRPDIVISVPKDCISSMPVMKKAKVMYVGEYMVEDPELDEIKNLIVQTKSPVGYSDHTVGVDWCIRAIKSYGCEVIEKHFTDVKEKSWNGQVFRDTIHGATPEEFARLAVAYEQRRRDAVSESEG